MAMETAYLVVVGDDGSVTTYTSIPKDLPEFPRVATNVDVYNNARQIVEEFEREILTGRIVQSLLAVLAPKQETPQDKVKEALKKRNIDPESVTPVD